MKLHVIRDVRGSTAWALADCRYGTAGNIGERGAAN
jgi:hypothetical protein